MSPMLCELVYETITLAMLAAFFCGCVASGLVYYLFDRRRRLI